MSVDEPDVAPPHFPRITAQRLLQFICPIRSAPRSDLQVHIPHRKTTPLLACGEIERSRST